MPSSVKGEERPGAGPAPAEILRTAREILPWMVEIRRELHRHPELGLEEHRTSRRIQELLAELDIDFQAGLAKTGVVGQLGPAEGGPVVALRADIDALPLQDGKEVEYRSRVPGRMHACGHDVHTAILLGAARILKGLAPNLRGTVKLIFQPAEETVGGAKLLIEEGVLENPKVDAIFGLHVDPGMAVGQVGLRYGQRNASSDDLRIIVHGRSGHGAYPAGSVDAIVVAAHVITALQTVVSRNVDARESAVISIGTIQGGTQGNIVAGAVEMVGTIRALDPDIRQLIQDRVRETAEGVASGLGATAEVVIDPSYDPLINHNAMVEVVRDNANQLLGQENVTLFDRANMGVEDFAYYVTHVPGAFYSLGVRNEEKGFTHPVHNNLFDVDEDCMSYGAALQVLNALSILHGDSAH